MPGLNRRRFVGGATLAAGAIGIGARPAFAKAAKRPNIVYILADDLGYADLTSFGGHGANTPVLDRLVAQGMMFPQAYANSSVCSPSRLALMTGRYPGRMRVGLEEPIAPLYDNIGLRPGLPTLPELLRASGYATTLVGKWHLGPMPQFGPMKSGYERFYGFIEGSGDYFRNDATALGYPMGAMYEGTDPIERIGYLTDQMGTRAVEELQRFATGDRPFFMSVHFNAPHWPWEGPNNRAQSAALVDLMDYESGSVETYAEMVRAMDDNIGRILFELRRSGQENDTIVIFSSDNGGERFSDSWPLIGTKGELLEGGIRVPLTVRWPGRVPAESVSQQVTALFDFYPTLLAAAGVAMDAGFRPDGRNMLDTLTGDVPLVSRKLFWRHKRHDQAAVRDGDWKYLRIGGQEHLFNLAEDVRERAEKKRAEPQRFAALKAEWERWNATMLPYPEGSFSTEIANRADRY